MSDKITKKDDFKSEKVKKNKMMFNALQIEKKFKVLTYTEAQRRLEKKVHYADLKYEKGDN